MDPLKEAQEFLHKLSDYQYTLDLVQDRIGPGMLELIQQFSAQSSPDDPKLQSRLAGFMLMGFLLHGYLERREIEERLKE
ncbi:MAG TPA: hypothetical protein V6C82_00265 [Chroococcales cyanobacterium]